METGKTVRSKGQEPSWPVKGFGITVPVGGSIDDRPVESGEFWEDGASDKTVYIGECVPGNHQIGVPLAKLYLSGRIWIEIELVLVGEGNNYLNCIFIVKFSDNGRGVGMGDEDGLGSRIDGDDAMLVDIAKLIQLPKGMLLRRTRSFVRLKCINSSRNLIGEKIESLPQIFPVIAGLNLGENGKTNKSGFAGIIPSRGQRKLPSHLIQTRTQTVEKFTQQHSHNWIHCIKLGPADIEGILNIFFCGDGTRFLKKSVHLPIEHIEVIFRPVGFHYYVG